MADIETEELAELLHRAGEAHHAAYIESDGVDPDWAMWYAGYVQAHAADRLGNVSRSETVYLLWKAVKQQEATGDDTPWPTYYAQVILEE